MPNRIALVGEIRVFSLFKRLGHDVLGVRLNESLKLVQRVSERPTHAKF